MTLARERGVSVGEVQAAIDAREFAEWLAFQEIDPASEERADMRAATIAWVIANIFAGKKQIPIETFLPFRKQAVRLRKTPEQLERDILQWARHRQRQSQCS